MPIYHVRPQDLGVAMWKLAEGQKAAVLKAMQDTVMLRGRSLVIDEIAATDPPPVDRGTYRRQWVSEKTETGAVIYNSVPYASIIEGGRRPGSKMPPINLIADWVRRKRIVRGRGAAAEAQIRGLAFVIARKIAVRGLPAKNVLGRAVGRLTPLVRKAIDEALGKPVAI